MKDKVCEYYFSTSNFMKANLWKWILCLVLTEVGIFLLPLKNQEDLKTRVIISVLCVIVWFLALIMSIIKRKNVVFTLSFNGNGAVLSYYFKNDTDYEMHCGPEIYEIRKMNNYKISNHKYTVFGNIVSSYPSFKGVITKELSKLTILPYFENINEIFPIIKERLSFGSDDV